MKFKRLTFSWTSPLIGVHYGRNPVSGARFMHVAYFPFCGIDFYWPEDQLKYAKQLADEDDAAVAAAERAMRS